MQRAIRRFSPSEGEQLDHGVYEASKAAVEAALFNAGYLRMKATKHRVEVARKENSATIDVAWESGPRMRFGAGAFLGGAVPAGIPRALHPLEAERLLLAGGAARASAATGGRGLLRHRLSAAGPLEDRLASTCRSTCRCRRRSAPSTRAGVYISTDTGPGVRVGMQRRWVNDKGHKFGAEIDYAQRLQAITTNYLIPLPGPNEKSLNFGVTYRDENTDTSQSRIAAHRRERDPASGTGSRARSGCSISPARSRSPTSKSYSKLFFAEGTLTRKQANDFFFPRRGYSVAFALRFAPEGVLTDTTFSQITADGKYIRPLGRRQRLLLRASLGAMAVDDFDQLPPELRFFAGGDRSIRGFDYQELGSDERRRQGDRRHLSRHRAAWNSSAISCRSGAPRCSWMAAMRSGASTST